MTSSTFRGAIALALLAVCLAGCAQTREMKATGAANFDWSGPQKRIVLIQPDVVLAELTAGGLNEPRADWTNTARDLISKGIAGSLDQRNISVTELDTLTNAHDVQLVKLHGAVGNEIRQHGFGGATLPTKGSALDWTLGPGTQDMRQRYNADYAMFVYVRDSYATAGRRAVQFLGAIAGIGIQGGVQVAFVSVVDLRTGNVVWFNTLFSQYGDLRDAKGATSFLNDILKGNPL
ncbi:MAG: hypothetical protein WDM91_05335 [Rhizomicrobium sp.]